MKDYANQPNLSTLSKCKCTCQGGDIYTSECPVHGDHPDPVDDHNVMKALKATSQADVMRAQGGFDKEAALKALDAPAVWVERIAPDAVTYEIRNLPNPQAIRVVEEILPKVLELYMSKSRDYGGNVGDMIGLGPQATFVDIWRKVGKLKRSLWDGAPMVGEQNEEILSDLVGHVFLILDGLRAGG